MALHEYFDIGQSGQRFNTTIKVHHVCVTQNDKPDVKLKIWHKFFVWHIFMKQRIYLG
jgi:hypothetical protein